MIYTDEAREFIVRNIALKKMSLRIIEHGGYENLLDWAGSTTAALAALGMVELFGYTEEKVMQLGNPGAVIGVFFRNLEAMGFVEEELKNAEVVDATRNSYSTLH